MGLVCPFFKNLFFPFRILYYYGSVFAWQSKFWYPIQRNRQRTNFRFSLDADGTSRERDAHVSVTQEAEKKRHSSHALWFIWQAVFLERIRLSTGQTHCASFEKWCIRVLWCIMVFFKASPRIICVISRIYSLSKRWIFHRAGVE